MYDILEFDIINSTPDINQEVMDYGVEMIGAPLEWNETMGEGIKVGVIDTGADITHIDLKDRIKEYKNFTSEDKDDDLNGHGTHVTGIIAASYNGIGVVGVAPKCDVYVAKAFNKDGTAENSSISESLKWLIQKGVHVINMSFASDSPSEDIRRQIVRAYQNGIILIAAAGNDGSLSKSIGYPAKWKEVIAVTAVDIDHKHADFSSCGKEALLAAPGKEIYSTFINNSYKSLSGTSMSTPLISGAAVLFQSKAYKRFGRYLSPEEMRLMLCMYADDFGEKGRDDCYGFGVFSFGRIK